MWDADDLSSLSRRLSTWRKRVGGQESCVRSEGIRVSKKECEVKEKGGKRKWKNCETGTIKLKRWKKRRKIEGMKMYFHKYK